MAIFGGTWGVKIRESGIRNKSQGPLSGLNIFNPDWFIPRGIDLLEISLVFGYVKAGGEFCRINPACNRLALTSRSYYFIPW